MALEIDIFLSFKGRAKEGYNCNKITTIRIQISHQNWTGFFSNISHPRIIFLTPIVSWSKVKWHQFFFLSVFKFTTTNLSNYIQMLILYLSYYITTTVRKRNRQINFDNIKKSSNCSIHCKQYSIQLQSFNKNSSHPILGLVRFPSVCSTFSMENDAQYWCFSNRYVFMDFFIES